MVKMCINCGKEIQDDRNFDTHVARCVFNRRKTLSCERCNKRYSYRSSLYLHKRRCKGPFACPIDYERRRRTKRSNNEVSNYISVSQDVLNDYNSSEVKNENRKYKYTLCLRTKTCHVEPDSIDNFQESIEQCDDYEEDDEYFVDNNLETIPVIKEETEMETENENQNYIITEFDHTESDYEQAIYDEHLGEESIYEDTKYSQPILDDSGNLNHLKYEQIDIEPQDVEELEEERINDESNVVVLEDYGHFNKVEIRRKSDSNFEETDFDISI